MDARWQEIAKSISEQKLERAAEQRGFVLFDPWKWPTAKGALARDRFHPSDLGYAFVADQVWDAVITSGAAG